MLWFPTCTWQLCIAAQRKVIACAGHDQAPCSSMRCACLLLCPPDRLNDSWHASLHLARSHQPSSTASPKPLMHLPAINPYCLLPTSRQPSRQQARVLSLPAPQMWRGGHRCMWLLLRAGQKLYRPSWTLEPPSMAQTGAIARPCWYVHCHVVNNLPAWWRGGGSEVNSCGFVYEMERDQGCQWGSQRAVCRSDCQQVRSCGCLQDHA